MMKLETTAHKRQEHIFFRAMAALLCGLVFAGFADSFYLRGVIERSAPSPLDDASPGLTAFFVAHGVIFTLWMLLFLVQSFLPGSGRVALHRQLGRLSQLLAPAVVLSGIAVTIVAARNGFHNVPVPDLVMAAGPFSDMLLFGGFAYAGWRCRFSAALHKRFMLLATLSLMGAAFGRLPMLATLFPPWLDASIIAFIPLLLFDLATRRLQNATLIGGAVFVAVKIFAIPFGETQVWRSFITGLIALI